MTGPALRGATSVREIVAAYLTATIPTVVDKAREDWDLDEYQLPYPVAYDAYEPYALDKWPLLGINVVQAGNFNLVSFDTDMSQRYLTNYTARVFTWVRTPMNEDEIPLEPEYSESIRLRDDLSACVRVALLSNESLGTLGVSLDPSSLTEEYSETTGVRGDRFVSGVVHSFTLTLHEAIPFTGIGAFDNIQVTAGMMNEGSATQPFEASLTAVSNVL